MTANRGTGQMGRDFAAGAGVEADVVEKAGVERLGPGIRPESVKLGIEDVLPRRELRPGNPR